LGGGCSTHKGHCRKLPEQVKTQPTKNVGEDNDNEFGGGDDSWSMGVEDSSNTAEGREKEDEETDEMQSHQLAAIRSTLNKGGTAHQFLHPIFEKIVRNAVTAEAICTSVAGLKKAHAAIIAMKTEAKQSQGRASLPHTTMQNAKRQREKSSPQRPTKKVMRTE